MLGECAIRSWDENYKPYLDFVSTKSSLISPNGGSVELMKEGAPSPTVRLPSCWDIRFKISGVGSTCGTNSSLYASMLNTVKAAAKRPAYKGYLNI